MDFAFWQLGLGVASGAVVGVLYFGGLWLTVRRIPTSTQPHVLVLGSFVVRAAVVVVVMALLAQINWQTIVAALAAMILTRTVLVRKLGVEPARTPSATTDEQTDPETNGRDDG